MLDALVQELACWFDLGGRAEALVRSALTYVCQDEPGGLNGVLDRFRKAGLGALVNSWIDNSAPRELTMGRLEGALHETLLLRLADRAGLPLSTAKPALALVLPRLIGMLTTGGHVPATMPGAAWRWLRRTPRIDMPADLVHAPTGLDGFRVVRLPTHPYVGAIVRQLRGRNGALAAKR